MGISFLKDALGELLGRNRRPS